MGPHGVDHAPDYVAEMQALVESHPTLTYIRPLSPDSPHGAVWDDDDGPVVEERETLGELVAYLRARFGR